MTRKFLLWWMIFVLQVVAIVAAGWFDAHLYLLEHDSTYLSFLIILIWLVTSIIIGYRTFLNRYANEALWFSAESCMTLGMIGTVVGFILMLSTSLAELDPSNTELMKQAISNMSAGMSTALLTTLVGLIASLFLKIQLINEEEDIQ
jgi:hypothetical protein